MRVYITRLSKGSRPHLCELTHNLFELLILNQTLALLVQQLKTLSQLLIHTAVEEYVYVCQVLL